MRMRGSLAGPERAVVLQPGLSVMLPDGLTLADGHKVDGAALAAFMAEPPAGFGPHGAELGAALAAHVQAWDAAGQPGAARLHVDAYPRSSADEPTTSTAGHALLIERSATRFVVYHT